jgi:prepilin-type N-terminal cleavage/methylation domain-containing protein
MDLRIVPARGVTALELLVAVAIFALLATLAVPGFARLRRDLQLTNAANELLWSLHLARSTAVLRGVATTLCLSADGENWYSLEPAPALARRLKRRPRRFARSSCQMTSPFAPAARQLRIGPSHAPALRARSICARGSGPGGGAPWS